MTKHGYEGLLIVIEGTDGSGKSTQLELLKKYIQAQSMEMRTPKTRKGYMISFLLLSQRRNREN